MAGQASGSSSQQQTMMIVGAVVVVGIVVVMVTMHNKTPEEPSTSPPNDEPPSDPPSGAPPPGGPNNNLLKLCGGDGTRCASWDITEASDGLKVDTCYNLNDTIGTTDLTQVLKSNNYCDFVGIASMPKGYSLQVNGLSNGYWPSGDKSCDTGNMATDQHTISSPNCDLKGCTSSQGFGNKKPDGTQSPGKWNEFCAFKLVKNE